ncbi:MAG: SCO1664 family protein [Anaerolineales bacterium]|nr:SCO1664 family protein [Anaerolineales bacterium]
MSASSDKQNPTLSPPADNAQILHVLTHGVMTEAHGGLLKWSSNRTFLVCLEYEAVRLLAVYKPQRGERPLWDFPDGTLCLRETAAYTISAALGWHVVPPTVLRGGTGGIGSVQYYIPHDPEVNYFTLEESFAGQLQQMVALDLMINNADRKGGHCLVDERGKMWGIDHGIAFHTAPKLRTVIWDFAGQPIPDTLLKDMERVYCLVEDPSQPLRSSLEKLLDRTEVGAFLARTRKLLQRREFPRPGPGPNYPWPPV